MRWMKLAFRVIYSFGQRFSKSSQSVTVADLQGKFMTRYTGRSTSLAHHVCLGAKSVKLSQPFKKSIWENVFASVHSPKQRVVRL